MNEKDTLEAWDIASIKVAIIGSGIMGNGIKEFLDSRGVKAYLISARSLLEAFDSSKDAIPLCDLIIECCAEDIATKKSVLEIISSKNSNCIIGTCTSSISVSELQESVHNSERFCGIHFMNPPRAINVVEVIPGNQTNKRTLAKVKKLLLDLDREVFEVTDSPGFAVNSVLISMLNQAVYTLGSCGLEPRELDLLLKKTTGLRLGPLATIDLIGVDVTVKIIQNMHEANDREFLPPASKLLSMIEKGYLGRKTKIGFFEYS
jgi:3-hydroxybutyryl-CoA dehydrogenase